MIKLDQTTNSSVKSAILITCREFSAMANVLLNESFERSICATVFMNSLLRKAYSTNPDSNMFKTILLNTEMNGDLFGIMKELWEDATISGMM